MLIPNSYQLHILQQMELTRQYRLRPEIQQLAGLLSSQQYWLECGATICVLPRQVGKTTLCLHLAETLPNVVLTTYKGRPAYTPVHTLGRQQHLIVDEYQFLDKDRLMDLLDRDWSSVLLVGGQQ